MKHYALIDIGSTLIDGPPIGPARWLIERLEIDKSLTGALSELIFTHSFQGPMALADSLSAKFGCDQALARKEVRAFWVSQREETYLIEGALEALALIEGQGLQIAYISNIWQPFYEGFLRCVPEAYTRHASFLSFRSGFQKPDVAFYRFALKELGCSSKQVLMIGDTYENDIAPAQALGLKTLWLLHRPQKEKQDIVRVINQEALPPDLTLKSIAELKPEQLRALILKMNDDEGE